MSTKTITVQNTAGQVVSFGIDPADPTSGARSDILAQRIARGELTKVPQGTKSTRPGSFVPLEDLHEGLYDEKGDLLKSVHGGGLDPDALGDALGVPSGSGVQVTLEPGEHPEQAEAKPAAKTAASKAAKPAASS